MAKAEDFNAFPELLNDNSDFLAYLISHEIDGESLISTRIKLSDDFNSMQKLKELFAEIYEVFQEEINSSGLCLLCVYEGKIKSKPHEDAFCRRIHDPYQPDRFASAIAVSKDALQKYDKQKLLLIILHEFVHSKYQDRFPEDRPHNDDFHNMLDAYIAIFNDCTGYSIANDYNQLDD